MNRLKSLRTQCNVSLRELEKYVRIPSATLSLIENEKQPFREIHVLKLTSFFDVTSDYLLGYNHKGIGIFFNSSEDDNDHEFISASELEKISERYEIKKTILKTNSSQMSVKLPNLKLQTYQGDYIICRYVEVDKEDVPIGDSLIDKITSTLKTLDTRDLEKVLKFINEFIK